ncbi:hypothetical protein [Glutamicibacter sp. JC586]|uniref:hypothetical protein n=1 Tax=Glutamicibacter sp. JC586 TaxID=2590552 RepID=UPI001358A186|nr:hypothetical protein [Glutamicibacter sp. JC586]
MIPQEDRDETLGAKKKAPSVGATRTPLHLAFQGFIGVLIGLGIASLLSGMAPARLALAGVIVVIVTWAVEQVFPLPAPNTKPGARSRLVLRLLSLIGFTLTVSPLLSLLE